MNGYTINGKNYLVHEGKLFAEVEGGGAPAPKPETKRGRKPKGESLPGRVLSKEELKRKIAGRAGLGGGRPHGERGQRKCGKCGKPGHTYRTCGRARDRAEKPEDDDEGPETDDEEDI